MRGAACPPPWRVSPPPTSPARKVPGPHCGLRAARLCVPVPHFCHGLAHLQGLSMAQSFWVLGRCAQTPPR